MHRATGAPALDNRQCKEMPMPGIWLSKEQAKEQARIASTLRGQVNNAIKMGSGKGLEYLGCSLERFMTHIERQFETGMSWNNYGEWEFDHVKPISRFDLRDRKQVFAAFNFENTRPAWRRRNRTLGAKLSRTGIFKSKFSYHLKESLSFENMRVFIPDEVIRDPAHYADNEIEFPAHIMSGGRANPNIITDDYLRLRIERDQTNLISFVLRPRRSTKLIERSPRYWEIRCHIGGKWATVHVTKCTQARFNRQIWKRWDEKLVTPGLATDLEKCPHTNEEVAAYRDPENREFRVSIRVYDEEPKLKITKLEDIRYSDGAVAAWNQVQAEIEE